MANLWDTLDQNQRNQVVQKYVAQQGNKTNENVNRAKEQLINNPDLVARVAKEAGIVEQDESVMQDEEVESDIEKAVGAGLEEETGDMQATGGMSSPEVPPIKQGESVEDYIKRLQRMTQGVVNDNDEEDAGDLVE